MMRECVMMRVCEGMCDGLGCGGGGQSPPWGFCCREANPNQLDGVIRWQDAGRKPEDGGDGVGRAIENSIDAFTLKVTF